ncbi:MAG TPA: hypothetical protein VEA69_17990 [Tepidisphaeraceae bacterium]|nr:hypothetical protein [Tepidisphaeraceae bacterium]
MIVETWSIVGFAAFLGVAGVMQRRAKGVGERAAKQPKQKPSRGEKARRREAAAKRVAPAGMSVAAQVVRRSTVADDDHPAAFPTRANADIRIAPWPASEPMPVWGFGGLPGVRPELGLVTRLPGLVEILAGEAGGPAPEPSMFLTAAEWRELRAGGAGGHHDEPSGGGGTGDHGSNGRSNGNGHRNGYGSAIALNDRTTALAPVFCEIPVPVTLEERAAVEAAVVVGRPRLIAHARPVIGVLAERGFGFVAPAALPVFLVASMQDEYSLDVPADEPARDDLPARQAYTCGAMNDDATQAAGAGGEQGENATEQADGHEELPTYALPEVMTWDEATSAERSECEFSIKGRGAVAAGRMERAETSGGTGTASALPAGDTRGGADSSSDEVTESLTVYELPAIATEVFNRAPAQDEPLADPTHQQDVVLQLTEVITSDHYADRTEPRPPEAAQAESSESDEPAEAITLPTFDLPAIRATWADQVATLPLAAFDADTGLATSGGHFDRPESSADQPTEPIPTLDRAPEPPARVAEVAPTADTPPALAPTSPPAKPVDHPKPVACPPAQKWKPVEWNTCGVNYRRPMPLPKVRGSVIDFHCHLFAARHARTWFEAAAHFGIDTFVTMTPLEECVGLARDWPGRIHFIAVPQWFYEGPDFVSDWLRRIEAFYNLGSRMAKFHMAPQTLVRRGLRLDSPELEPVFRELRDRGMMVMTHMGDPELWYQGKYADTATYGTRDEHYTMWENVLNTWTHLPWVGAHMGGNPEDLGRLQGLLDRHPNLSLDCSATRWMAREVSARRDDAREFFVRNADRILFGSDQVSGDDRDFDFLASRWWTHRKLWETGYIGPMPILDPDLPASEQPRLRGLALPDEVLQKLYHDNAVKVMAAAGVQIGEQVAAHSAA